MPRIKISLEEGTVFCTPSKGNVWAKNTDPASPDRIEWTRGRNVVNFRLRFFKEPMQGHATRPDWPFEGGAPEPPNGTGIVQGFDARVGSESGVYEYTVEVNIGSVSAEEPPAYLDPMIIVGRG